MAEMIAGILEADATLVNVYTTVFRWIAVALAAFLLFRCMKPLLTFRREPEIWAWLCLENGRKLPITHWENVIGRSKRSDIVIDFPTVSKNHAVLTRYDDGSWTITDAGSKAGTLVNGKPVSIRALRGGETITIGPAFSAHDFTDRMGGAYPLSANHYTVYFTAYTPVERVIRIRAGRKDRHL